MREREREFQLSKRQRIDMSGAYAATTQHLHNVTVAGQLPAMTFAVPPPNALPPGPAPGSNARAMPLPPPYFGP